MGLSESIQIFSVGESSIILFIFSFYTVDKFRNFSIDIYIYVTNLSWI